MPTASTQSESASVDRQRLETGAPAQALRGPVVRAVMAVAATVAAIELLSRTGLALADPRPVLFAVLVYAAMVGGAGAALVSLALTAAYVAYYFSPHGPVVPTAAGPLFRTLLYVATAPVMAAMVLVLRRQAQRESGARLTRAVAEERRQVDARTTEATARLAERQARKNALNRAVLGSLPIHIAVLDADGRIVDTNAAWERFARENAGQSRPTHTDVGTNYLQVCTRAAADPSGEGADGARSTAEGIRAVLEGRTREFSLEYPCHSLDHERWFLLSVTPLDDDPAADLTGAASSASPAIRRGAVVTHMDITHRNLHEQALRQRAEELAAITQALRKSNEELDQFAYITSHDLRAPLRGIANLSTWIEEDMGERFTPQAHEQMELLRGRVHRMEAMIDGILDYSRVGRVKNRVTRIDVSQLLDEIIDLLAPPANFTIDVTPHMPVIIGDRLRLQQVFQNLLGNAIKHHDAGRAPGKSRGTIRVDCRDAGEDFVEFAVSDDGPGIEPQYHERIFTIFQTLRPRDQVEGTGVGLALVRKVVESQCGAVNLQSEPGKGATFRFTWPKRDPANLEAVRPGGAAAVTAESCTSAGRAVADG